MEVETKVRVTRNRWPRGWSIFFGVVILAFLGFLAVRWYEEYRAEERIRAACVVADADDPNWRLSDMLREYEKLPPATAFAEMRQAYPGLGKSGGYLGWYGDDILDRPGALKYDENFKPNVRLPEAYLKILQERLQDPRLPEFRKKIAAFSLAPKAHFPTEIQSVLPWLQESRTISNFVGDEVLLAVLENRMKDALIWLGYGFDISEQIRLHPTPISNLVSVVLTNINVVNAQKVLMFETPASTTLTELQSMLAKVDRFDPVWMIKLVRAEGHRELELVRRDSEEYKKWVKIFDVTKTRTNPSFIDQVQDEWESIRTKMALSSLSIAEAEILEVANEDILEAKANPTNTMPLNFPSYIRTGAERHHLVTQKVYDGVVTKLLSAHARYIALVRATIAAIACERYRIANGKWPETLEALVPTYLDAVPLDPYTGKPLLYRVLSDGAVVYSVGRNMIDDGGAVLAAGMTPKDYGVRLFDPKLRGLKYEVGYPAKESTNGPDK